MESLLSGLIIGLFVLQIVVLIVVGMLLRQMWHGPIGEFLRHVMPISRKAARLSVVGWDAYKKNKIQVLRALPELKGILAGLQYGARTDIGAEINYKKAIAYLLSARAATGSVLGLTGTIGKLFSGSSPEPQSPPKSGKPTVRKGRPVHTLADRMGLVPPIVRRLHFLPTVWRVGRDVYREVKKRGLLK